MKFQFLISFFQKNENSNKKFYPNVCYIYYNWTYKMLNSNNLNNLNNYLQLYSLYHIWICKNFIFSFIIFWGYVRNSIWHFTILNYNIHRKKKRKIISIRIITSKFWKKKRIQIFICIKLNIDKYFKLNNILNTN